MIWDNLVYLEEDEKKYVENHRALFNEIYNKDIYYVKDNMKALIKKYKILGYYCANNVIQKDNQKIKVMNRYIDD